MFLGQRLFLSFPSLSARLGSTFFPRGVHISREISTEGVVISQEISTGGVLIFGEYLFSVTPVNKHQNYCFDKLGLFLSLCLFLLVSIIRYIDLQVNVLTQAYR